MMEQRRNSNSAIKVSFIIPMLNEEENIGRLLDSIHKAMNRRLKYEIIVVDNGSRDRSVEIARLKGAMILIIPCCMIGTLRNNGAASATGEILVFLDADVVLCDDWGKYLNEEMLGKIQREKLVTGSFCHGFPNGGWIERYWFNNIVNKTNVNYINSAHLIFSRTFFHTIGGFRDDLETGEDYDLCLRARKIGATIYNCPDLKVLHTGFPKTIIDFFRRERWHGRGDFTDIRIVLRSKPALVSLILLILLVVSSIYSILYDLQVLVVYVLFFVCVCLFSYVYRYRALGGPVFIGTGLYAIYFAARALSLIDFICGKTYSKIFIFRSSAT